MKKYLLIVLTLLCSMHNYGQICMLYRVPGQDEEFSVQTTINPEKLKQFEKLYTDYNYNDDSVRIFEEFLMPSIKAYFDAYAAYLYARCYEYTNGSSLLLPFLGTKHGTDTAMRYYAKAAEKNIALADYRLYEIYRYGYMYESVNHNKAYQFLKKAILHGDAAMKTKSYLELAKIFNPTSKDSFKTAEVIPNDDSCIYYLKKILTISPQDFETISTLADKYIEQKEYDKMYNLLIKSGESGFIYTAAVWLIEGKYTEKQIDRGIKLLHLLAAQYLQKYPDYYKKIPATNDYYEIDPIWRLNELYVDKKITKQQVGRFYNGFLCEIIRRSTIHTIKKIE